MHISCARVAIFLGALVGTQACTGGASVLDRPDAANRDADTARDGDADRDGEAPVGRSWCGEAGDLACCPGWSGVVPGDATPASEPPPPEPLRAVDEATRVWLAASAVNVDAEWRGLEASGDATRPSRLTLEVSGVGSMRFDLARAVSDFPVLVTGTGVRVSGAPTASLRITRTDGALVLGVASACDLRGGISDPTRLPAFLAPLTGGPGAPVCREPVPTYVANDWCYVGRSEHSVLLDSVSTAVAPGATVRASVGGARYDFINHRFAIQDEGGPLRGNFCLPAISALCSVSAYAVVD